MGDKIAIEEMEYLIRLIYTLRGNEFTKYDLEDNHAMMDITNAQISLCYTLLECLENKKFYNAFKEEVTGMLEAFYE